MFLSYTREEGAQAQSNCYFVTLLLLTRKPRSNLQIPRFYDVTLAVTFARSNILRAVSVFLACGGQRVQPKHNRNG